MFEKFDHIIKDFEDFLETIKNKYNYPIIKEHLIKDNKVIVKLSNGNIGEVDIPPEDKFDFAVGTELAIRRAYENVKNNTNTLYAAIIKQSQYCVGDKVKIVDSKTLSQCDKINQNGKMNKWAGKIMTVKRYDSYDSYDCYIMEEDECHNCGTYWHWLYDMIEGRVIFL